MLQVFTPLGRIAKKEQDKIAGGGASEAKRNPWTASPMNIEPCRGVIATDLLRPYRASRLTRDLPGVTHCVLHPLAI
jgi:hypothetical protein